MSNIAQALGGAFVPADVPASEFELIPSGEYVAIITETDFKDTSKGGKMLEVKFQLQTSAHEGRVLTERLNLVNSNPKAVEIALQTLAKISTAAGLLSVKDSSELHGKRMKIKVDTQPGVGTYIDKFGTEKPSQAQNVIKGYNPMSAPAGDVPFPPTKQPAAQAQPEPEDAPPAADEGKRPWA